MFIPPGRPVHENLASSYIVLEALVDDLCEGGFSGIIEIILRAADCYVVVNRGVIVVTTERLGDGNHDTTTIGDIAARARRERGRISVYSYGFETAAAVAGRLSAAPLYSHLSTEFADPEKMINKLRREKDREWFIEINVNGGSRGLIHIVDNRCLVVTSQSPPVEVNHEVLLSELVRECKQEGGVFDVYFREPGAGAPEAIANSVYSSEMEQPEEHDSSTETRPEHESLPDDVHAGLDVPEAPPVVLGDSTGGLTFDGEFSFDLGSPPAIHQPAGNLFFGQESDRVLSNSDVLISIASPSEDDGHGFFESGGDQVVEMTAGHPGSGTPEFESFDVGEALAEVKRLMGEIARTVENATRPGEGKDSFSMSLKSGQLKVADRYPFLDPFGSEFEYHAGEIAFVGIAEPSQFVAGLAEAIRYAIINMAESSSQPARLLARVEEDLLRLLEGRRQEFELLGLEKAIEQIIAREG